MKLENDTYQVEITVDAAYTVGSADNHYYDYIFNPEGKRHNDISSSFHIRAESPQRSFSIVLIGSPYSYDSDCAVLEGDILTVLQNHRITRINLQNVQIEQNKYLDLLGVGYAVYLCQKGYLVYGELEITMLNRNLDKLWEFGGKDIFTFCRIEDGLVHLRDWENTEYFLDMEGNLANDNQQ